LRVSRLLPVSVAVATVFLTAPAQAHVPHTVEPGETLWSLAATSNLTARALAAANGLPEDAQVLTGSTIQIPSEQEAAAALAGGQPSQVNGSPPEPMGAYVAQPGDTLSGIAASSGISVEQLAWMNGVDASEPLLIGTPLKLPTGAELAGQAPAAPAAPEVVPDAAPHPTPGQVTAAEVGEVAASHGVSSSLAAAIAWQESGFNNGAVSTANARGVMQILPGTWSWIENELAGHPLAPDSPIENVHAGVMYLGQLVQDAGGDEARAVASYYQGLSSINRSGLLPDTRDYVDNVMALRSRFGGS
jgi:LysM repeat protein